MAINDMSGRLQQVYDELAAKNQALNDALQDLQESMRKVSSSR
jgi:hypothetical protein